MKHFFTIFTILILFSCSKNNEDEIKILNPVIQGISVNSAFIGETIIIKGQNFNPNTSYIVKFNGVNGQVTQVTANSISVIVPNGATSGQIQLISNGETINVGNITINIQNRLFAYKAYNGITELNLNTGAEIGTMINTGTQYLSDLKFLTSTNQIIGQRSITGSGGTNTYKFFKLDISNNSINETNFIGYESLIETTTGKLFAYKAYTGIVELNPNTGAEIGTLINTGTEYLSDLKYFASTNQIIGQKSFNGTGGTTTYKFFKLNISNNSITETNFIGYESLIETTTSKLFAYKAYNGIVELNSNTGAEIGTIINTGTQYLADLKFLSSTNQIIGQRSINGTGGTTTYKLFKLNVLNNLIAETNFIGYESLIIK